MYAISATESLIQRRKSLVPSAAHLECLWMFKENGGSPASQCTTLLKKARNRVMTSKLTHCMDSHHSLSAIFEWNVALKSTLIKTPEVINKWKRTSGMNITYFSLNSIIICKACQNRETTRVLCQRVSHQLENKSTNILAYIIEPVLRKSA